MSPKKKILYDKRNMATFEQISDSSTDPDDGRPKYNITGVQPYTLGYIPEN